MRIAFYSTMGGLPWGGSEELWCRAAMALCAEGHEVAFSTMRWKPTPAPLERLIAAGAKPHFRRRSLYGRTVRRNLESLHLTRCHSARWLQTSRPDLVLISLSCHTEDPQVAVTCRQLGIRYAILLQAANPANWITNRWLQDASADFAGAERCYFVSAANREVMEANLAAELPQMEIVDNPFGVRIDAAPGWPTTEPTWKLAAVGRLNFNSKSQDILLQVMRRPKWRQRPLEVTLWGKDQGNLAHTLRLIDFYGLRQQVAYGGFSNDVETLWSDHHGLLLPSRFEGNSLTMIEAMICGRVPIVTNVGRVPELVENDRTGFVAPAATVDLVDEVLERAWQRRHEWQAMGVAAAASIRQRHSLRPAEDFAERLLAVAASQTERLRKVA